jgi:hypothetical protein
MTISDAQNLGGNYTLLVKSAYNTSQIKGFFSLGVAS